MYYDTCGEDISFTWNLFTNRFFSVGEVRKILHDNPQIGSYIKILRLLLRAYSWHVFNDLKYIVSACLCIHKQLQYVMSCRRESGFICIFPVVGLTKFHPLQSLKTRVVRPLIMTFTNYCLDKPNYTWNFTSIYSSARRFG